MTLQADAGRPNIIGEVMRLDGSFIVQVLHNGELMVRAFGEDVSITRLITDGANMVDGKPHAVTLRYADKSLEVLVDGDSVGQMQMSGSMATKPGADLQFGNPWGGRNFKGDIKEFTLSDTPSGNQTSAPQAAMSHVELAQDLDWFAPEAPAEPVLDDIDSFDFVGLQGGMDMPLPSYSSDALFDG